MTLRLFGMLCVGALLANSPGNTAEAQTPGRITGVGGVFIKAKDPKALAAWYRDVLGMPVQSWGGAVLSPDASNQPTAAWRVFGPSSTYLSPSSAPFMVNYTVDDMDAIIGRLRSNDVDILKRDDTDDNGRFVWVVDPEGNKVELWEPKRKRSAVP